jgi:DNA processing protein
MFALNSYDALFLLHQMDGVGHRSLEQWFISGNHEQQRLTPDTDVARMSEADWCAFGLSPALARRVTGGLRRQSAEQLAARYRAADVRVTTYFDESYPHMLKQIANPPMVLYSRGDLRLLSMFCFAIVGTRVATVYGKKTAYAFGRDLAQAGLCVVSGLASGIDGKAHEGALSVGGATIAVLGSSADIAYPAEHRGLYEQMVAAGLVLSEWPLGTTPQAGLFPLRNRIISGLSHGVLVVEAAQRSGSLITAELAAEQSRDVFAVPGPIGAPQSVGTLDLIKDGAVPVTELADILSLYQAELRSYLQNHLTKSEKPVINNPAQLLSADEQHVLTQLSGTPLAFDELFELLQIDFGQLHAILLSLLLKKQITQWPGMSYTRNG